MARLGFRAVSRGGGFGARSARIATWSTKPAAIICLMTLTCDIGVIIIVVSLRQSWPLVSLLFRHTCSVEGGLSLGSKGPITPGQLARTISVTCRRSFCVSLRALRRRKLVSQNDTWSASCSYAQTAERSFSTSQVLSRPEKRLCALK